MSLRLLRFLLSISCAVSLVLFFTPTFAFAATSDPEMFYVTKRLSWIFSISAGVIGFFVFLFMHKRLLKRDKWVGLFVTMFLSALFVFALDSLLSPDEKNCFEWAEVDIGNENPKLDIENDKHDNADKNGVCRNARVELANVLAYPFDLVSQVNTDGTQTIVQAGVLRTYRIILSIFWSIIIFLFLKFVFVVMRERQR